MAAPATRQQLIDYCLRELGHPVVEINVDDDQVSDRIDAALQYYQDYHYDGVERLYLKQQVTATRITLGTSNASNFALGTTVTGSSSGAYATVCSELNTTSNGTTLLVRGSTGTWTTGETIVGANGTTSTVASVSLGNVDRQYFQLDDSIIGVRRVLPFSAVNTGQSYMWDIRYQLRLNDMFDLLSTSIIYYEQVKAHLALIDQLLVGSKSFRFQRHQNRLYLDMSWNTDVSVGEYVIVECYKILNPDDWTDVYNDRFLKRYATALIKKQWGNNLKKFAGIQMPGGITLNGQVIYDEAVAEIAFLENEAQSTYVEPPDFMVG
jgi:hypothetical protein